MKVLTDLDQLIGKTIKHIEGYNSGSFEIFIVTTDKAVAHLTFEEWTSYGDTSVVCNLVEDELDIYQTHSEELYDLEIIDGRDVDRYEEMIADKEKEDKAKYDEEYRKIRFEQYLELKKEFEVEYKL